MLSAEAAAATAGQRPVSITSEVAQFTFNETGTEEAGAFEMMSFVSLFSHHTLKVARLIVESLIWWRSCVVGHIDYDGAHTYILHVPLRVSTIIARHALRSRTTQDARLRTTEPIRRPCHGDRGLTMGISAASRDSTYGTTISSEWKRPGEEQGM